MAKKLGYLEESALTNIANAIRNKNGQSAQYSLADMPNAISAISTLAAETADATATAANIQRGATAYVSGIKVVGTHDEATVTDMTADATATASDIVAGKTAYVAGEKVAGTMEIVTCVVSENAPDNSVGSDGDIYLYISNLAPDEEIGSVDDEGEISLNSSVGSGTYTLYYEDESNEKLAGYDAIGTITQ